jgi:hypothetical protein
VALPQSEINKIFAKMRGLAKPDLCDSKLSKFQVRDAFQALDDFWETNRLTLKSNMETAIGASISNQLAKKLGKAWLAYKAEGE